MDRKLFRRKESAISPIIATLLLILIAIASGVILYAYVSGFLANSTQNTGTSQSIISIQDSCLSLTTNCGTSKGFLVVIQNLGSNTIAAGTLQIYFTDVNTGAIATVSSPFGSSIAPSSSTTASGTYSALTFTGGTAPSAGDTISIKVVMPDGGTAASSIKAFS